MAFTIGRLLLQAEEIISPWKDPLSTNSVVPTLNQSPEVSVLSCPPGGAPRSTQVTHAAKRSSRDTESHAPQRLSNPLRNIIYCLAH